MKAWIARDEDGELYAYDSEPYLTGGMFLPASGSLEMPNELMPDLPRGYKQPIELTATPLGDAERGGEG